MFSFHIDNFKNPRLTHVYNGLNSFLLFKYPPTCTHCLPHENSYIYLKTIVEWCSETCILNYFGRISLLPPS